MANLSSRASAEKMANGSSTRAKKGLCVCPICDSAILEAVGRKSGQDAIECEGSCSAWLHRHCAGLSKEAFKAIRLNKSNNPFFCMHCRLERQEAEIESIKSLVTNLASQLTMACDELASLKEQLGSSEVPRNDVVPRYSSVVSGRDTHRSQSTGAAKADSSGVTAANNNTNHMEHDRKFNLVIFGIIESNKGTPRHIRIKKDMDAVTNVITTMDPDISGQCIRDSLRIGVYKEDRNRPMLVNGQADVVSVLSNRVKLALLPGIKVKADQSVKERTIESFLLRERRSLITAGTERRAIKIRGNTIFLNSCKHGEASESGLKLVNHELDSGAVSDVNSRALSPAPTPPLPDEISNQVDHTSSQSSTKPAPPPPLQDEIPNQAYFTSSHTSTPASVTLPKLISHDRHQLASSTSPAPDPRDSNNCS